MCVRDGTCCTLSLRTWAIIIGVFTVLETVALIVCGGYFLHRGLKATDYGGTTAYVRPQHRIGFDQAFGALYLAFGAIWLVCAIAYAAAVLVERALYLLPWLVFQAITLGLGVANMLSNSIALRDYGSFGILPVIFLFIFFYVLVFSYYLELQNQKRSVNRFNGYQQ